MRPLLFLTMAANLLKVISYNLHGFNQGSVGIKELMVKLQPDIIMVQEHWLTPDNLWKLNTLSDNYSVFGSSAMAACVSAGPLVGRPFGGTAIVVNNKHISVTENITSQDRFTAVKVHNWLLITVYMPSAGTPQRDILYSETLLELQALISQYPSVNCLIGGDFNIDLDSGVNISRSVNQFICQNDLHRCDLITPVGNRYTYVNETTNARSAIDYMLSSNSEKIVAYNILDIDINLSDHLPIMVVSKYDIRASPSCLSSHHSNKKPHQSIDVVHLRWDHAPLQLYYEHTGSLLQPVLDDLNTLLDNLRVTNSAAVISAVDHLYDRLVAVLCTSANLYIPKHTKNFYKFWWSQELDVLKQNAIQSSTVWKNAGKPRGGAIYSQYKKDKLLYKKRIREEKMAETAHYSNDLHEALLRKSGQDFWKTWKSKFEHKISNAMQVDGITDSVLICGKFAKHFETVCSPLNAQHNNLIKDNYKELRSQYYGTPITDDQWFDDKLISKLVSGMANGKAAGLDQLSSEHLKYSHPVVVCILTKLFNLFLCYSHIPSSFGCSYTVPVPKCDSHVRALRVDDFRGISISPVISKLFEMAILDRFSVYLRTSDHQFGFKKNLSCRHAIYCVRNVIEKFVKNGSTVSVCTLDLSKAFDRMNHYALFVKLMERKFPSELLAILEMWFNKSVSCVKWNNHFSNFFCLSAGVRQGGVLSPYLFAVFMDDIVDKIKAVNLGCYFSLICTCIFLYADDIVLLAPSVSGLQQLLHVCEKELEQLDMKINVSKSMCIRFGPRFNVDCAQLTSLYGGALIWVNRCRYLGVYFESGRTLKFSFSNAKARFLCFQRGVW